MAKRIQDGIYYKNQTTDTLEGSSRLLRNKTFSVVFLRAADWATAGDIGKALGELWRTYSSLKRGYIRGLRGSRVPGGGLDVLIGYGKRIFSINGAKKVIPNDMQGMQFSEPHVGNEPIAINSGMRYARDIHCNYGTSEDIIIQFTSHTQLATFRAVAETWLALRPYSDDIPLKFTNFFSGFQRDDGRSWLGFHDEISNLKNSRERLGVIAINRKWNRLTPDDLWTENGTYLAFLRISIDLFLWERIERKKQELIVGRDKISGRPISRVDKKGNPVINLKCPIIGKFQGYNQDFHDHPNYFLHPASNPKQTGELDASIRILNQSHIGRTRHIEQIDPRDPSSNRIFRQGFEFIEQATNRTSPVRLGLNFVSFQNDPHRLFSLLTSPHWLGGSSFGGDHLQKGISNLFSVNAAGVFFVPPPAEPFPGVNILA